MAVSSYHYQTRRTDEPLRISLFEKGKRRPGLSTLEKITKTLDVPQHLFTLLAAEPEDEWTRTIDFFW